MNLVVGVGVLVWLAMEAGVLSAASATGSFVVGVLLLVGMLIGALLLGLLPSLLAPWELLTRFGVVVVGLFWLGVLLLGWVLRSPEMYAPLYALPLGAIFASHDDPLVRWGFVWLLVALVRRTTAVMRGDFVAASVRVALLVLASLLVPFGFALIAHWLYVAIVPTPPVIARAGIQSPIEWLLWRPQQRRLSRSAQRSANESLLGAPVRWPDPKP